MRLSSPQARASSSRDSGSRLLLSSPSLPHSTRLSPSFFIFSSFSTFFLFLNFLLSFPFLLSYVPLSGRTTGLLILCFEADIFVLLRNVNLFISTGIPPLHVDLLLNLLVFHTWSPLKMFPSRSSDIKRFAFSISKFLLEKRRKKKGWWLTGHGLKIFPAGVK